MREILGAEVESSSNSRLDTATIIEKMTVDFRVSSTQWHGGHTLSSVTWLEYPEGPSSSAAVKMYYKSKVVESRLDLGRWLASVGREDQKQRVNTRRSASICFAVCPHRLIEATTL